MPYTSVNGNMFSFLAPDGTLALRLPSEQREAFIKKHKTALMEQHGTVLKEYVRVPESVAKDARAMRRFLDVSHTYASGLKPKKAAKR
jgi:hypothetical protein